MQKIRLFRKRQEVGGIQGNDKYCWYTGRMACQLCAKVSHNISPVLCASGSYQHLQVTIRMLLKNILSKVASCVSARVQLRAESCVHPRGLASDFSTRAAWWCW